MNRTWFANLHPLNSENECLVAFSDIENMTIERFYNNYLQSNGLPQYRYVVLGQWSIDLKRLIKFLSDLPENTIDFRMVIRGSDHQRRRPESSRFMVGSLIDSLTKRSITDYVHNWLGHTWQCKYNNN